MKRQDLILWIIGIGFLFPLFFKLSGSIYNSVNPVWDSGGVISQLPLPVSLLACCGGLFLLAGRYRRAALALSVVASMALLMVLSLVLAGPEIELRKVVLIIQVLLPTVGLVLGQLIEDNKKVIPRAFLGVLLFIVPVQLLVGWVQGNLTLTHHLYIFSIYQHFQFVPLVLVCGFAYSMSILWDQYKTFYLLTPLVYLYAIESLSFLTIFAFVAFVCTFSFVRLKGFKKMQAIILFGVAILGVQAYLSVMGNLIINNQTSKAIGGAYQYLGKFQLLEKGETPRNVQDRIGDWSLYGNGIVESVKTAFIGHPAPFPREVKTSAHNWYLDMAYNFGLISLLPVVLLLIYTLNLLWQGRADWPPGTVWLAAIVLYLVVIDSNFKVTLRQPYPGIFAFFLWGLLLSSLKRSPLNLESR